MVSRDTVHGRDEDDYELGDLELARPVHGRPAATPEPAADEHDELPTLSSFKPSLPENDYDLEFAASTLPRAPNPADDYGDEPPTGPALELDLPAEPVAKSGGPAAPSAAPRTSAPPGFSSTAPAREEERAARELARFREPPAGFMGTAGYALHVARRAFTLYRERRELEQLAESHAEHYEQALDALGRALLSDPEVRAHEGLREPYATVEQKQRALEAAEAAARDARAREERELAALKLECARLERELEPFVDEERRSAEQHAKLELELKRKEAQVRRADIELRALEKASIPPPAERRGSIESERGERSQELARLTARQAESSAELARARRDVALRRGALDELERRCALQLAKGHSLHGRLHAEITSAERALRVALCALAEAADRLAVPHTAADEIRVVRLREVELDEVVARLTRYDRALSLYDRAALVRGALIWGAFVLALVLLLRLA